MNTATLKPVFVLSALLLSAAPLAAEDKPSEHGACPHHNNVEGGACSHHGAHCKHGKGYGPRSEADMAKMREQMDALGLTDTQKQEMASLFGIYQPRIREIVERGHADREALVMATPGSDDYNSLVGTVSQEASASAGEMVVLMAELQSNAFALLTDEQQAKYLALKADAREKAAAKAEEAKAKREARKASSGRDYSRKVRPVPE